MQKKPILRRPLVTSANDLPEHIHPVIRRVYAARSIDSSEQLDHSLKHLLPVDAMAGMKTATALLVAAIDSDAHIMIVADFDADGATACAVAVSALRAMGASNVGFMVPNRFKFGYGLTPEIVHLAAKQCPHIILTVDNGITSCDAVDLANQLGIKVIVTDHHLPGKQLPKAAAIVNPNLAGDLFASKHLAGVGVIFYVMLAVRAQLRELKWFTNKKIVQPNMAVLLDLVALGTVADVVPLDRNNRILVEQGLQRIRSGQCCAGIKALVSVAGKTCQRLTTADLGFAIGPRLNAAGRLQDMSLGINCLLTNDPEQAADMAQQLESLNRERRSIETKMKQQALNILQNQTSPTQYGVCMFDEQWHQGVIGILASRLKDRLHRPVIVFAADNAEMLKGSGRSIAAFHLSNGLAAIASANPGLLAGFGGHAMAAGLKLRRADFPAFSTAFDKEVRKFIDETALQAVIESDGELQGNDLNLDLAEQIRFAGPWGQGFPEPLFDGIFNIITHRIVGKEHLKLTLQHCDETTRIDAIAFNSVEHFSSIDSPNINVAYRLDINEYRGTRTPQLIIEHMETVN